MDRPTPPEMVSSNLRYDDVFAQGSSAKMRNVTDMDSGRTYLFKLFHTNEAFMKEKRAYERMADISTLSSHIPVYYGVGHVPDSIILGKHDGRTLEDVIWSLSHEARDTFKWKVTEILDMLHNGGVTHRHINSKNIIIQENQVLLVNFCHAVLKEDVEDSKWDNCKRTDDYGVAEIFDEVQWAKAYEEATSLIENLRNGGDEPMPQICLVRLLGLVESPAEELARSILDVCTSPEPLLALPLADHLAGGGDYEEAIKVLTQAAAPFDNQSLSNEELIKQILQIKVNAARYLVEDEQEYMDTAQPPSNDLYEDAVRFYLYSTPGRDLADDTVMNLRYEFAEHCYEILLESHAMEACIRALEGAMMAKNDASLDILKKYVDLIEDTKKRLAHKINSIRADKERGTGEHTVWAWAKLPTFEQAYSRAEEARRFHDDLWAQCRVPKAALLFQVTPSAGYGRFSTLRRNSSLEDYR
ncbi:Map kinase kinase kinase win1 [Lasiodiplodia theobromae]|uniref:Map kinase kinase kinase win1 n=1 Tax=Lasiodiplodia theobromae TaxID=45133 RepID=UPI0015C3C719|nr:Map kinase kinase kinase win1 [Lasiodiplodia theobromae]KAF4545444.1 Map kinase kinase kinase win1 [Lasiodiplodia theobromae]